MTAPLDLNSGFDALDEQDWLRILAGSQDPEEIARVKTKLCRKTLDNIEIQPLYRGEKRAHDVAGRFPYRRGTQSEATNPTNASSSNAWAIRQIYRESNPSQLNETLLNELERGVNSAHIVFAEALPLKAGLAAGVQVHTLADLQNALNAVYLDLITLSIDAGNRFLDVAAFIITHYQQAGISDQQTQLAFNADPLGTLAFNSELAGSLNQQLTELTALARLCTTRFPNATSICVNTSVWHIAGASNTQELGAALATGLFYVTQLVDSGLSIDQACHQITFRFAVDAEYFQNAAKLRAARELWAHVCRHCGASDEAAKINIHAITSTRMLSSLDEDVNQLRNCIACASAALGGADSISVEAHRATTEADSSFPVLEPDELTRRIARNIQLILQEETHLDHVGDPLGGSGYIEQLTDTMIDKGWSEFQTIEADGGMRESLTKGLFKARVTATADKREHEIQTRRRPQVGVSEYAIAPVASSPQQEKTAHNDHQQQAGTVISPAPTTQTTEASTLSGEKLIPTLLTLAANGASLAELVASRELGSADTLLPEHRLTTRRDAEIFEHLHSAAMRFQNNNEGEPVSVFLCAIGELRDCQNRLGFTENLLAAGGIACQRSSPHSAAGENLAKVSAAGTSALLQEFAASNCSLAILCSSDSLYEAHAELLGIALKNAGAVAVWLAGSPGVLKSLSEQVASGETSAIDACVHLNCNAVEKIDQLFQILGVSLSAEEPA